MVVRWQHADTRKLRDTYANLRRCWLIVEFR